MNVSVIIVAAGQGSRMGGGVPKQLLEIGGRTILQRSVAAFDAHPDVRQIVVVLPESLLGDAATLIGNVSKRRDIVAGGARRQDSVANGMSVADEAADVVLVHDAARPFAGRALIDRVIAAAAETGAAVPAIGVRDTVKRVTPQRRTVTATIPRAEVWLAQTPQGFRRNVLVKAIAAGRSDQEATDEAMLAEQIGQVVQVVDGDVDNVKVTGPEDLAAARSRFESGGNVRIGTGYDLHRLASGRPLVLAGVNLPFDKGPVGHSDGDVVCHALVDAMFGAAGAGDIGRHFPNTDPQWKDAPGLDLLGRGLAIVRGLGWSVVNADVTVVLEQPKVGPHVSEIRQRLAAVLGVSEDRISIKGKTNEGVDAVGRGEAIAAHAVVMLEQAGSSR